MDTLCVKKTDLNLIPSQSSRDNLDYCSTWDMQGGWLVNQPTHITVRDVFTDEAMFGENGWAYHFPEDVRKELIVTICDGWDLPYSINGKDQRGYFGSFIIDPVKFPGYGDTPQERLKTFSRKVKEAGWKGLGLWICCHEDAAHRLPNNQFNADYWIEKLRWSKDAGILYWENDWGDYAWTDEWRQFLSDMAQRIYPELIIEHITGNLGTNDARNTGNCADKAPAMVHCAAYSDVFRTYDVTTQLTCATTTERVARLLKDGYSMVGPQKGIICCEDEMYMAATMGFSIGIMRNKLRAVRMLDEVVRCVHWHRLAPTFEIGATDVDISEEILTDAWHFTMDTWDATIQNTLVKQHAPAAIGRGVQRPEVVGGTEKPRLLASRNPITGALSIATMRRTSEGNANHLVYADIAWNVGALTGPVGVFGVYNSLTMTFDRDLTGLQILAQDLMGGTALDVTAECVVCGNVLKVPGNLITYIGTMEGTPGDVSEPGLMLQIGQPEDWTCAPKTQPRTRTEMYRMVLSEGEGYRIVAQENTVERMGSFSFRVEILPGYDNLWMMVTANDLPLQEKDGVYTIDRILADQVIRVHRVLPADKV